MARIAGVDIPDNKRVVISLTYIYGIGRSASEKILDQAKINSSTRVKDLSSDDINTLRNIITDKDKHIIEGDLRRDVMDNVKRLRDINTYRGTRHARSLPSRGQRTKTNSRTRRGNKRATMGSGRRPSASPT